MCRNGATEINNTMYYVTTQKTLDLHVYETRISKLSTRTMPMKQRGWAGVNFVTNIVGEQRTMKSHKDIKMRLLCMILIGMVESTNVFGPKITCHAGAWG